MNNSIFTNKGIIQIAIVLLLGVIIYFPIFLHLTQSPIRVFDESRLALNAYEMSHGGNWIVTYYEGTPDMWNTKPPLMIWSQTLFIYLLGLNELPIRLPAALAAFLTCGVLLFFCFQYWKKIQFGFVSVLILVTTPGYIHDHVARTGDYDSLLTLLTTTYILCYFIFIENQDQRSRKFLTFFFIALTLGVLCKGIQGLMFIPALVIYTLIRKKAVFIFRQRNFYYGILFFFVFGLGYYFLREILNPGYIQSVWNNEIGGRYGSAIDEHQGSPWFYFKYLFNEGFNNWYWLFPCGVVIGLVSVDKQIKRLSLFLSLTIFQYLIVISFSQTKISWYAAPLYPLLALVCGLFLDWICDLLRNREVFALNLKNSVAPAILIFLFFINPYSTTIQSVYEHPVDEWSDWWYQIPNYMRHAYNDNVNIDKTKIIYSQWPSSILFYQKMLKEKNVNVVVGKMNDLNPGDKVMVSEGKFTSEIESKFDVELVDSYNDVQVYKLVSRK